MAIPKIKATYALDVDTVRTLERMAHDWKVSRSEALRRAIRAAAGEQPPAARDALAALDEAQRTLGLDARRTRSWAVAVRRERRAASERREPPAR